MPKQTPKRTKSRSRSNVAPSRGLKASFRKLSGIQLAVVVALIVGLGIFVVWSVFAATPKTTEPETWTSSSSTGIAVKTDPTAANGSYAEFLAPALQANDSVGICGRRVANYTYRVPFGNAVWNQPVCNLPVDPKSADYSARFWNYRNLNDLSQASLASRGNTVTDFGFESLASNFSRPVYYAKDATKTIRIATIAYDSNLDGANALSNLPQTAIPWNDTWQTGKAGDNEMVILNDQTGELIFLAGVNNGAFACLLASDRLCTYTVQVSRNKAGTKIDYRTFEGSTGDRGSGISWYATLTTPEEVAAGEIRHAIGMSTANTAIGPECSKAQLGTSAEGTICGTAVAPASKFEWASATKYSGRGVFNSASIYDSIYTLKNLIPEGARFRLNVDDAYIENWINSRSDLKSDPQKAQTARIFARAMRDYGIIIVDTSNVATIQVASVLNPKTKAAWANVGINDQSDNNLVNGLITDTNISMLVPPTNTCYDGSKSKYYCNYETSSY